MQDAVRSAVEAEKGTFPSRAAVEVDGNIVRIGTDDPAFVQPIIDVLRKGQWIIQSVRPVRQSLEDFFIEAVADNDDDPSPPSRDGKGRQP